MLLMRTTKDPADPLCKLVRSQQTVRLDDLAFAVDPLGLYGVQPRTPLGQKTTHHPHSTAALLDAAVVFSEPAPYLLLEMCQLALSQMRTNTFLPRAWSFSQFHSRNWVVIELTGLPSTNLSHVSPSSSGR